ncbi:hypothetical protein SAMN04488569_102232 [Marinilactibacillus piezotolerans]|uniref:Uncharacterized protein n=1 Tax=Marinilactibacillus piezotolerans TaxID=258723 RepID=A0A1I3YJE8_9LACT|nr:hypothetical protein [Marinilactibacillus piezotolerans]SFK31401.1 hypothetical protein SAMN04488569_102232 [Marinilactibacillus piezotolerans]
MGFKDIIKTFWKKQSNQSQQLIKEIPVFKRKNRTPLSIEYKIQINASELTSNQETINQITASMIKHNQIKRNYAGKQDEDLKNYNEKVYKYESYSTKDVKLIPNEANRLDIYINSIFLGKLPKNYTSNTIHYLQSTVIMAFAYIKGGPYKYFNKNTQSVVKEVDPFDISIYIQFS